MQRKLYKSALYGLLLLTKESKKKFLKKAQCNVNFFQIIRYKKN